MPEPLLFLLEPLDVQAASYLAASDNILNFSLISISSFISILDIISLIFEHLFDSIIAHMFEYVNRQLQEFNFNLLSIIIRINRVRVGIKLLQ